MLFCEYCNYKLLIPTVPCIRCGKKASLLGVVKNPVPIPSQSTNLTAVKKNNNIKP